MRSISFLLLFVLIYNSVKAQHCPYDGMHLIAINIVDKQGQPVTDTLLRFYLQEIDNPMADSCSHSKGLINKQFLKNEEFLAQINNRISNTYSNRLIGRLTTARVLTNANRFISINQTENTCILIGKSESVYTNYIYRQRKFEIVYTIDGKEKRIVLPDNLIYALCTGRKDLEKFKPFTIKL